MANISAFYETRNLFIQYTSFCKDLTYDQWKAAPQEKKSALLFVQFYDQICQAWHKANAFDFIPGEDGVSVVCQYLEKNVPIIDEQPSRFKPSYIYKVAYNCMYCICHDLKSVKDRWDNETSAYTECDGKELCLFDAVVDRSSAADESYERLLFQQKFWAAISEAGLEAEKVVNYLLSGDEADLKKVSKRSKSYREDDPLAEVSVMLDDVERIVENLRTILPKYIGEVNFNN